MMNSFAMVMMILLSGNSSELLDMLSCNAYWQAKGVQISAPAMLGELKPAAPGEDPAPYIKKLGAASEQERDEAYAKLLTMGAAIVPEVKKAADSSNADIAARAQLLLKEVASASKASQVRRLMAIRALGELKDASAVTELKKLLDSKTLFEPEYAARAIAAIEGKPAPARADLTKQMKSDLGLLPRNCGLVLQANLYASSGKARTTEEIIKSMAPTMGGDPASMLPEINKQLITLAETVGNVRLEGLTLGLADNVSNNNGFVVFILRGLYDAEAMQNALQNFVKNGNTTRQTVGKIEFLKLDREFAITLQPDRAVLVGGPSQNPLPLEELAAALESGKGKLSENKLMTDLIASTDTTGPLWGAALVSDAYRQAGPLVAPFDTAVLSSKKSGDRLDLKLLAKGSDANEVSKALAVLNAGLIMANQQTATMAQQIPTFKPLADFMASIKPQIDGATVTITASLSGDIMSFITLPFTMRAGAQVNARNRMDAQNSP